jgi:hypothetical protein
MEIDSEFSISYICLINSVPVLPSEDTDMGASSTSIRGLRASGGSLTQVKLWQLAVLVAFAAVALVDIKDHGRREPALVGLAAAGYAAYGLLCWLGWHGLRRFQQRLGVVPLAACYVGLMGMVFLAAVIIYLLVEYVYLGGSLF